MEGKPYITKPFICSNQHLRGFSFLYKLFMAENKKSFLLYCDLIHTIEQMPKDLAGELFLHILKYVNDKNPESENLIINLTFEPIKQSLKRDLVKYEKICNRNGINGLKGGRPKNPKEPKEPSGLITNPKKPKQPDSDSDSDSDSEIILLNNNITPLEIALNNFYKFRKELKKPIVETSKEALKNKLIKLSNNNNETAIEIINQSMANGWQGIFELKNNQNGTNKDSNGKPISKYHN